jgi:hypothetical protein
MTEVLTKLRKIISKFHKIIWNFVEVSAGFGAGEYVGHMTRWITKKGKSHDQVNYEKGEKRWVTKGHVTNKEW